MSRRLTYWLISTQVNPDTKVALAGVRPSTLTDALHLLDQAYADAGTKGGDVFRKDRLKDGLLLRDDRVERDE